MIGGLPISGGPVGDSPSAAAAGGGGSGGESGSGSGSGSGLWARSRLLTGLSFGSPVCEVDPECADDAPGTPCDLDGQELVVEFREVVDPRAWLADDGEWVLLDCCGAIEVVCCDEPVAEILSIALAAGCGCDAVAFDLTYDSAAGTWKSGPVTYCGETDVEFELECDPDGDWQVFATCSTGITTSGDAVLFSCSPFRIAGSLAPSCFCTIGDDVTTITFEITASSSAAACEVWGYEQTLYVPDEVTIGDEECRPAVECLDCETEEVAIPACGDDSPCDIEIPEILYGTFLNVSDPTWAALLEGHSVTLFNPQNWPVGTPGQGLWGNAAAALLGGSPTYHHTSTFDETPFFSDVCDGIGADFDFYRGALVRWQACREADGTISTVLTLNLQYFTACEPVVGSSPMWRCDSQFPWLICGDGRFTETVSESLAIPCSREIGATYPIEVRDRTTSALLFTCDFVVTE